MSAEFGKKFNGHAREVGIYARDRAGILTSMVGAGSYYSLLAETSVSGNWVMGVLGVSAIAMLGWEFRQRHNERAQFLESIVWQGPEGGIRMRDISEYFVQPHITSSFAGRLPSGHFGYEQFRDRRALRRIKQEGILAVRAHAELERDRTIVRNKDTGTVITLTESKYHVTLSSQGQETNGEGETVTVKRRISYRDVPYTRRCGSLVVQAQEERIIADREPIVYSAIAFDEVQELQKKMIAGLPLVA